MRPSTILLGTAAVSVLACASAVDAKLTLTSCAAQKRSAWTNLRKCQGVEDVKRIKGKTADFAKCDAKLQAKLAQISGKATAAGIPCRYAESDDGTITDYDLGLQWEEKTGGTPTASVPTGVCFFGDVHCVNNFYDWSGAHDFVGTLNGATDDGHTMDTAFAGHSDWRLPTIFELETLKSTSAPGCGSGSPCIIDGIFNTRANVYWSSTPFGTTSAFDLDFGRVGGLDFESNPTRNYVRAVRTAF